jgi:hypothetical protein
VLVDTLGAESGSTQDFTAVQIEGANVEAPQKGARRTLRVFYYAAGSLNKQKKVVGPTLRGRMLVLDMRVEVGTGTRHVIASGTY